MPSRTGRVHVATTSRTYKGKLYQTHLLRRTFRVGSQVRHETLGNISHLPPDLIDLIRRSLAGEQFLPASQAFLVERNLPHGHVQAVLGSMYRLGLDSLLASKPCRERDLVLAMIAERLLHPCSKLATTRLWHTTTLAEELGVADATEDDLYQAMDWLLARQSHIEKKLAQRHLHDGSLVLYDVSSSYYEGHTCPLARLGHNRDGKKGLPIIVYGLLTDSEGRPVAVDVYPGNTGDPTTVPDQVDKLRQRFGLSRVVLVGDRGMLTETQIGQLKQHPGLGWISALRGPAIGELVDGGSLQLSLFDETNLAEITSPAYPGERLVACFNPLLADERRRKRGELIEATEKELAKIAAQVKRRTRTPLSEAEIALKTGKVLNRYKVAKHFELNIADGVFAWTRREESIRRESQLDGVYVVRTSEPESRCSAPDAVRRYKSLAQVERAFRSLKGMDLRIRPIHHRTEDHVRAHILLCMLAFYVEWHMRRDLAPLLFQDEELSRDRTRRDPVAPAECSASAQRKKLERVTADGFPVHSFETLLRELATRCRNTCRIPSDPSATTFQQLTEPTALQARALRLLGL
ncbi:IS1634 family transposase [uncultured Paludibaculum sp.]|uniref:IS1634 family transposase n=2 Tax=uncultured Paludibaculum sp. TaxID=1765020 RepID=UPI002AAAEF06|nr:IS1634 family transposase [uncultured Paludibaculum sp.]